MSRRWAGGQFSPIVSCAPVSTPRHRGTAFSLYHGHVTDRLGPGTAALLLRVAVAVPLELAAGAGLAYLAGFGAVRTALGAFDPAWTPVVAGALLISFGGYLAAYWGIFRVEGGPSLSGRQIRAVAAAGFGGFLANGTGALERIVLEAAGADRGDARVRLIGLAALEQAVLAFGACGTSIAVLAAGAAQPSAEYTVPWAVIPVPGLVLAFWVAERYRHRLAGQPGWRGVVGTFLVSVHLIRQLLVHPWPWASAVLGMALFWAADAFVAWSALAAFGYRMDPATFFVGFATGMVFTRRTGPLAGAGILALVLPLTIWTSGAPFAIAVVSVFTYRMLCIVLPLPFSLAVLPTLSRTRPEAR
jgi:hypothetical protein